MLPPFGILTDMGQYKGECSKWKRIHYILGESMNPIYVTGHRNPDTDSIVAAMAYTALRNALGDREYEAACLGSISDETQIVLKRFGFKPPKRLLNVYTQVKDLDYDTPPILSTAVTVGRAWSVLQEQKNASSIAVVNEDGALYGMLSREDIAKYNMGLVESSSLRPVPLFNLLSVLEGKLLNDAGDSSDMIFGEVIIALPENSKNFLFHDKNSVVVCGNQPDMIQRALERNVNCLILCRTELSEKLRRIKTMTSIISTPYDAYRVLRLIFQSVPAGRVCQRKNLISFQLEERIDNVREQILKNKEHCYAIVNCEEKVVGVLNRQHLLRPRRKRVVLVDHNEAAQSVPGLEEAEIVEIIDHHRLADIQTANPIYVRNEPVGSTNTIIAEMFQERGLLPSENMAGMMAAAIVSDTVMFKSPTCTARDRKMAERMARIANISLEELSREIFATSLGNKDSSELLFADYKEFHIAGYDLAISQITCMDSQQMLERKEEFLTEMRKIADKGGFSLVILMLTDVLLEGTQLLYIGEDDIISQAFNTVPKDNLTFLPRVMSRKKQIIPELSALWG